MMNRWLPCAITCTVLLITAACGKKKPCEPLPVPEAGQELVLESGVVCKDKGGVMSIDYPRHGTWAELQDRYTAELADKGWQVTKGKNDGMLIASKNGKNVLIVLVDNKGRGVPSAVVTY